MRDVVALGGIIAATDKMLKVLSAFASEIGRLG